MTETKQIHSPSKINRENFEIGCLKTNSYSKEEISRAIIDHVGRRGKNLTERQTNAIRRFKYAGTWNLGKPDNQADLVKFFEIFNDMYFNRLLKGYTSVEFLGKQAIEARARSGTVGYCYTTYPESETNIRVWGDGLYSQIMICTYDADNKLRVDFGNRISWYLQFLIHEMLHAIFATYRCRCDDCDLEGKPSHHLPWQAAAQAIENAEDTQNVAPGGFLLGLHLKLNREVSIANDMQSGAQLPISSELVRVGLDIKEILTQLHELRVEDEEPKKDEFEEDEFDEGGLALNRCIRNFGIKFLQVFWPIKADLP